MPPVAPQDPQAPFLQAVRLHQAGRLTEAEQRYRDILATQPRHADCLHLLGVIATQAGRHDQAIDLIRQAIAINGRMAPYHANLGTSLRALGRLREAEASYRRALQVKADYADAYNHLGTTLRDLGQLPEAEDSFRHALRLRPDYADAHNNLGNLLRESGRVTEAETSYRQALATLPAGHPKAAPVLRNLGTTLRDLDRLPDALASYDKSLRLFSLDADTHHGRGAALRDLDQIQDAYASFLRAEILAPGDAALANSLAGILRSMGRVAAAERLASRALQLAPDLADAHNALGAILHDLGRLDEAERHMQRAVELTPAKLPFHLSLSVTRRYQDGDPHLAAMEKLLADSSAASDQDRLYLHFALAKAYEDLGDKDRSFAQQLLGNRLKRQRLEYDEAATLGRFEQIAQCFSAELLAERSRPLAPAKGPIFIVGMMRSGSTLIEQVLASHPQVWGAGELTLFRQAVTAVAGHGSYPVQAAALDRNALDRIGGEYLSLMLAESPRARRVTDKYLHNFLYCGLIRLALPNARILHTRRDPVDTCLSCYSKLFVGNHPFAYDLAELGRYWRGYDRLMEHWRAILAPDFMLEVNYEEVVDDLEGQARRILAHCGLPWDDACLSFYNTQRPVRTASALQVRQPIYRSSVGRWRPDAALLAPLTTALSA